MTAKMPKRITVKRQVTYSTEDELLNCPEFYENEEDAYKALIEVFYDYAVEDLASPWAGIVMLDADTGEEIPYEDILEIISLSKKI